jgi:tRNA A37 threonylcarbamoyladenosine modification protein TsaB
MFLLLDLSQKEKINLALFDENTMKKAKYDGMNRELLSSLDSFLSENNFDKKDLKGVMVVVGEGSFTNTRISCVVANTLGFTLGIPLLAIKKEQTKNLKKLIKTLVKEPVGQYISATYSAPPNIG